MVKQQNTLSSEGIKVKKKKITLKHLLSFVLTILISIVLYQNRHIIVGVDVLFWKAQMSFWVIVLVCYFFGALSFSIRSYLIKKSRAKKLMMQYEEKKD